MTAKEGLKIVLNEHPGLSFVECVDLEDRYGYVLVDWDPAVDGPINKEKAYATFLITGWLTVDKKTGITGEQNAASYFHAMSKSPTAINLQK